MSEERPTFKVTDRRLFNSDGTPREGAEREEEEQPAEEATAAASTDAGSAARAEAGRGAGAGARGRRPEEPQPGEAEPEARAPREASQSGRSSDRSSEHSAGAREEAGGAASSDPTPFANLVMFIASPAAAAMGMTEHPGLAPGEIDLPLAKHCIDLLATVREKSRGNLSAQEQQILEGLLAELRMQYVELSGPRSQPPPRGFSGGDITGGR